jgi:hypothetical protein
MIDNKISPEVLYNLNGENWQTEGVLLIRDSFTSNYAETIKS